MEGNVQKFGFLKNPLSESGWWSTWLWFKNTYFWSENFFQRLLENFLRVVWSCSIYLEGCPRSYLYTGKKIRVIRHTYQKVSTKTRFTSQENPVQNDFPLYHCRSAEGSFSQQFWGNRQYFRLLTAVFFLEWIIVFELLRNSLRVEKIKK